MRNNSGPDSLDENTLPPRQAEASEDREEEEPEWLVRELLRQNSRRHSVTLGGQPQTTRQQLTADTTHSLGILQVPSLNIPLRDESVNLCATCMRLIVKQNVLY